jgi:hypothetical protein
MPKAMARGLTDIEIISPTVQSATAQTDMKTPFIRRFHFLFSKDLKPPSELSDTMVFPLNSSRIGNQRDYFVTFYHEMTKKPKARLGPDSTLRRGGTLTSLSPM